MEPCSTLVQTGIMNSLMSKQKIILGTSRQFQKGLVRSTIKCLIDVKEHACIAFSPRNASHWSIEWHNGGMALLEAKLVVGQQMFGRNVVMYQGMNVSFNNFANYWQKRSSREFQVSTICPCRGRTKESPAMFTFSGIFPDVINRLRWGNRCSCSLITM